MVVEGLAVNKHGQNGVRQNTKRLAAQKEPGKAPAPVRPHNNEIAIARLGFLHDPFRCKLILNVESFASYADALSLLCHACKDVFRIRRCGLLVFLGLESNGPLTSDSRGPRFRHVHGSDLCSMHLREGKTVPDGPV